MAKKTARKSAPKKTLESKKAAPKKAMAKTATPTMIQPPTAESEAPSMRVGPGPDDVNARRRGLDPTSCGPAS